MENRENEFEEFLERVHYERYKNKPSRRSFAQQSEIRRMTQIFRTQLRDDSSNEKSLNPKKEFN